MSKFLISLKFKKEKASNKIVLKELLICVATKKWERVI